MSTDTQASATAATTGQRGPDHAPAATAPPAGRPGPSRRPARRWVRAALSSVLVASLAAAVAAGVPQVVAAPLELLGWALAVLAAALLSTDLLGGRVAVSLTAPVLAAGAVLLEPGAVALVAALAAGSWRVPEGATAVASMVGQRAVLAASAAMAAQAAQGTHAVVTGEDLAIVLSALVALAALTALATVLEGLARRVGLTELGLVRWSAPPATLLRDVAVASLWAILVVAAYQALGFLTLVLLALPLLFGWGALHSAQEAAERAHQLDQRVRELEALHLAAQDLLSARSAEDAAEAATRALQRALGRDDVRAVLDAPAEPAPGLRHVPVPDAPPAVVCVPADLDEDAEHVVTSLVGGFGATVLRQRLERKLAEVQRARADLAGRILEEGVRERSRLALALHDEVMPTLSGAQMAADNTASALEAGDTEQAAALAAQIREAAAESVQQLRAVLADIREHALVPGTLRERLSAALEELRTREGIAGRLEAPDPLPDLPFAVEVLLLEASKGCLANVAQHADADEAVVRLVIDEREVRMEISDNGCGFDRSRVPDERDGLELLRQRVELARGRFLVESRPGQGTTTVVEVPR